MQLYASMPYLMKAVNDIIQISLHDLNLRGVVPRFSKELTTTFFLLYDDNVIYRETIDFFSVNICELTHQYLDSLNAINEIIQISLHTYIAATARETITFFPVKPLCKL